MPAVYLTPLLIMMAAWGILFLAIWLTAIRTEIVRRRVVSIRARKALEA
jgi:heme exporter protein C